MTPVRTTGNNRPGPRTVDDYRRWVTSALRNLDDGVVLLDSPLTRLPGVERRAAAHFGSETFPTVLALRAFLVEAVQHAGAGSLLTCTQMHVMRSHLAGESLTSIAPKVGRCRQHVSTIWRKALTVISAEFVRLTELEVSRH